MGWIIEQHPVRSPAAGRRICIFLVLLVSGLWSSRLQGAYHNPVLKVLLFSSKGGVYLTSQRDMTLSSRGTLIGSGRKILVTPDGPRGLRVNNSLHLGNFLVIRTTGKTQVQDLHNSLRRNYLGDYEIRLLKNRIHIINLIPTEQYLEGVLNAEISTRWHIEVVKAQAVISRTFALFKREKNINQPWYLSADQRDQVYKGVEIADERGRAAIRATAGIVVAYRGHLAQTFYHSNCGGITADPGTTWQHYLPYLKVKAVPFGRTDPRYRWKTVIMDHEMKDILRRAGMPAAPVDHITISKRTSSNRVFELTIAGRHPLKLSGNVFRKASGFRKIQSLLFEMRRIPGGYRFDGKGNGHGVGLSQWSAKEMAERGYKYHEIIYFFYSDIELMIHQE